MAYTDTTPSTGPSRLPRLTVVEAICRHWFIALLPVILLVGAGAALALSRNPVYTAETRMQVGNVDLTQPGALGAFTTAGETLAESFSRAADADAVVRPVAKKLDVAPQLVRARVSATPVPASPVFRVIAKAESGDAAARLTHLTARQLQRYSVTLNRPEDRTAELYRAYKRASLKYSQALDRQVRLDRRSDGPALVAAEAETRAAAARLGAIRQSYNRSAAVKSSLPATAHVLTKATGASSDRRQVLQLYVFIGLVAGALAGAALASFAASRTIRRSLATR